MVRLLPLLLVLAGVATHASPLRETWQAMFSLPALFLAPGWGPAARSSRAEGGVRWFNQAFHAAWLSLPVATLGWGLGRLGGGAWTELAVAAAATLLGVFWPRARDAAAVTGAATAGSGAPPTTSPATGSGAASTALAALRNERLGGGVALLLLLAWFGRSAGDIARPLDRYWYLEGVDRELPEAGRPCTALDGWAEVTAMGDPAEGLTRLRPAGRVATLSGCDSRQAFAMRAPVGAEVDGLPGGPLAVLASPVETSDEGPVWRYLDAGVAGRWVGGEVATGEPAAADGAPEPTALTLTFSQPESSTVFLLPTQAALWTLHGSGELRYAHYYQLLNMVEQLRWAQDRWVTDVQPPLWTWILGPALALTGGGQPTANVLFTGVLALTALAGLRFLRRFAPDAPAAAWGLPGLAAVVTGKLLMEPGSTGMPDALYAVAIVAALAGPTLPFGIAAQLLRYPATGVVVLGALLSGAWREAARLVAAVFATAAAFGLLGWLTGALDGWLRTVAWESGPEHWHGQTDPAALLARIPAFYRIWLLYAGGTPLLAAVAWPKGTRVALGTALGYSLLLCTIDHSPSHYFVPLVQLAAVACGCSAAAFRPAWARTLLATLGAAGLAWFCWRGELQG